MRKRPLCFFSIILVVIMWMIKISGDGLPSPDIISTDLSDVSIYGVIYKCEYKEEKQILYLKQTVLSDDSQKFKIKHIRITCKKSDMDYQVSDEIYVTGDLKKIKEATNPGQFDIRTYYSAQKISYIMWEPEVQLIKRPAISLERFLYRLRTVLADQYDELLSAQYSGLLKGMTLGDKNDISEDIDLLFQIGGISHILAISALHLQILGESLYGFLRRMRVPIGTAALISGIVITGYGMLTGASVATLRALIMFLIRIGADVAGRTYDSITGMAIAAVVLTAGNPDYLQYSGFWLSFFAVSSFMIFKERRKIAGGILLYMFMAPIMLNYFYELSPYSIFTNLIVIPTTGVVLITGILGCVCGLWNVFLGRIIIFPSVVLLYIYKYLCEMCRLLPGHTLLFGKPGWVQIFLYYTIFAVALYFFRKNRIRKVRFAAFVFMIPAWLVLIGRWDFDLQITMLDVGQGDSIVIESETGNVYMIDGGSTSEDHIGKYRILPYLKYKGIREIDAVFLSHADADHMNGILELLEMINANKSELIIQRIVLPNWADTSSFAELYKAAWECEIEIYKLDKNGTLTDGGLSFVCLHPNGENYNNDLNEGSMVLRVDYKDFSMLFTGDLERESETELLGTYGDIDVLKVAHHGSEYSTSEAFLKEVKPETALISCGENNLYGHPHEELLRRLEKENINIFRTDQHGAVTIRTDGEKIDLKTFKQYNES